MVDKPIMMSVTQINDYIKMLMDGDRVLSNITVCGEISNFKYYQSSGHLYFTLKDVDAQLKAVMFRTNAARLSFRPADGMRVVVRGHVSVYPQNGQYQLYADAMQPDGAGTLAMQYERLRLKLAGEGLFDEARKKPLPNIPMRVGVITSPSGAAVHDIRNVLARRFPCAEMILFPSAVQGVEAPEQLRAGILFFGETAICDVIIIGRGGGSAEDLWAFNDEALARAIADCPIPVISAVGHESDFTICDFVADRRAPTPSAAAELAVPDRAELASQLEFMKIRMSRLVNASIDREKQKLKQIAESAIFRRPERTFETYRMRLSGRESDLLRASENLIREKQHRLAATSARLEALNPLSVLSRGYAAVSRDGVFVPRMQEIAVGDTLDIRFADGIITATAKEKKG